VRGPSAILKCLMSTERAAATKAPGPDVIPMHTGDPDFPTPPFIAEALNVAVERGYTDYGPSQGDPELRAVIDEQLSNWTGTSWSAAEAGAVRPKAAV
jgi:aspartate aminotransferase